MAIPSGSVQNITTTASVLGTSGGSSRRLLVVRNPTGSGATIYLGGSNVTSSNAAFVLNAGDNPLIITSATGDSLASEKWYAVTASGTATGVTVTED